MPLYLNTYSLQFRIPQGRFPQPQMAALLTTPNKGTLAWPRIGLMSIRLEKWTLRAEVVSFYLILGTHACSNLGWYFVGSSTPWHWTICHQTTLSVTPSSPNTNSVSCLSGLHLKTSCCEDCRHKWYFHLSSNYYLGVFSTSSTLLMWISCPTSQNLLLSKPPVLLLLLDVPWPRAARAALQRPHLLCSVVWACIVSEQRSRGYFHCSVFCGSRIVSGPPFWVLYCLVVYITL